jgi:DNA-binding protein HU-beta
MSITIKELVDVAATASGTTKKAAEEVVTAVFGKIAVVTAVFGKIAEALKAGEEVTVRDFGRFHHKTRDARTARNPRTGESVQVPAKTVIKFTPRGAMK